MKQRKRCPKGHHLTKRGALRPKRYGGPRCLKCYNAYMAAFMRRKRREEAK